MARFVQHLSANDNGIGAQSYSLSGLAETDQLSGPALPKGERMKQHNFAKIAAPAMMLMLVTACSGGAPEAADAPETAPAEQAIAVPGDGDSQGDATVAGTNYNATALIPCAGYKGAAAGTCEAGVIRGGSEGTTVEVKLADGTQRIIFFNPDGSFLSFSTAEADGTAAMAISSERKGDVTIAKIGSETYDIPDVLLTGD